MKVILQENVEGLGYLGDLLTVADGYGRNYLLPRRKAVAANTRNLKSLEHIKRVIAHQTKKEMQVVEALGKKFSKVSLTFRVQTGKDDKLFGSVTNKDVADELDKQGLEVDRRKIQMAQPIKELGNFSIPVKLHRDVVPEISITVLKKGRESPAPEESQPTQESESIEDPQ